MAEDASTLVVSNLTVYGAFSGEVNLTTPSAAEDGSARLVCKRWTEASINGGLALHRADLLVVCNKLETGTYLDRIRGRTRGNR